MCKNICYDRPASGSRTTLLPNELAFTWPCPSPTTSRKPDTLCTSETASTPANPVGAMMAPSTHRPTPSPIAQGVSQSIRVIFLIAADLPRFGFSTVFLYLAGAVRLTGSCMETAGEVHGAAVEYRRSYDVRFVHSKSHTLRSAPHSGTSLRAEVHSISHVFPHRSPSSARLR